ncbi:TorD/DmsD family molecular chaperone [Noviherbaspirillum autotrophicum]|uniref:Cytochrome c oxidase subunit II n=1 Tax=Noviherbaspirillum autotrophicum TaxID=709839 RepID=A0A0C2BU03_9BURK|nr:molecular chaperone TorD family protein [Noviherbaspirillum autotrophicum]KIF83514.1 cytochrome c oxidase subunit II [Noviherbaspirillum autotrophicum]
MTSVSTQALRFEAPYQGEESARADLYGLLATLFYGPPTKDLLDAIAQAPSSGDGVLQQAWNDLAATCEEAQAQKVRDEYESLFIGVGKPEIMLYASFYLSGFLMEKPLAALRSDLDALRLQRSDSMPESEDHIAAMCEVMRYLILSEDAEHSSLDTQKRFFSTHLQQWAGAMCDTIMHHPQAVFYSEVAQLAKHFFDVETQAFDMA